MKLKSLLFVVIAVLAITSAAVAKPQQQQERLTVVRQVAPVYPDQAKRAKVEGKVTLDVTVEQNGEVSMAKVLNGHQLLQQAAVDAVMQWRFSNPFNDPVTIQLTLDFALKAGSDADKRQTSTAERPLINTYKVDAVYPAEAKRRDIQGEVSVEIRVNDNGEVIDAKAVSGNEALRQAAVDAAKQFRFTNNRKTTVGATLTFNFVLRK